MSLNVQTTGTSGVNDAFMVFCDRVLLEWLRYPLFFAGSGDATSMEKRELPKASGTTIQFLRPTVLAAATTALTEGTDPSGASWATTKITAIPLQYGNYISFSDRLELEAYDSIVEQMHEILGYNAGLTLDTLARNALTGSIQKIQTNGSAETDINTVVSGANFRYAATQLRKIAARPFDDGAYHAIVGPGSAADLQADTAIGAVLDVNKYVSLPKEHEKLLNGMIGRYFGMDFQESPNVYQGVGAATAVTYHNVVLAHQCFGQVDVDGMGVEKILVQPTPGLNGSALGLVGVIGFKFYAVFPILDSLRGYEVIGTSNN